MEFLYSNLPPLKTASKTFAEAFYSLIPEATRLDIAVGYITVDSLAELMQTVTQNENIKMLNLIIGMHYWDKFTKLQYDAAIELNKYLRGEKRGEVKLVKPFRFHGKLYSYSNAGGAFAGIIGSNNLGSIIENRTRTYEASLLLRDKAHAENIFEFIKRLSKNASDNIGDCKIDTFDVRNKLLEDHEDVENVSREEMADAISALTDIKFIIPLVKNGDVPKKSNLNVYFGEGRRSSATGLVKPRHWYEIELMVPNTITTLPNYPQKDNDTAVFDVITDDGWKFKCKVSGDYSKNLRSKDDLKILGRWIKGRLEISGALEVMQPVTPETFEKYRRDNFTLTKTTIPNLWFLDFGVPK
jgi:uncharacterized protein YfcZ (UPF0381/DUF406 family)